MSNTLLIHESYNDLFRDKTPDVTDSFSNISDIYLFHIRGMILSAKVIQKYGAFYYGYYTKTNKTTIKFLWNLHISVLYSIPFSKMNK